MDKQDTEKKDIVQSAKSFVSGMLSPLKGRDIAQLVEEFTSEMTIVAEGLSEDQRRLDNGQAKLENRMNELETASREEIAALKKQVADLQKENEFLKAAREKDEKEREKEKEKERERNEKEKTLAAKKGSKSALPWLRQATWLVGIFSVAWIVTSILNLFK